MRTTLITPLFVRLTEPHGTFHYVNAYWIRFMRRVEDPTGKFTEVYMVNSDDPIIVKESVDDILVATDHAIVMAEKRIEAQKSYLDNLKEGGE